MALKLLPNGPWLMAAVLSSEMLAAAFSVMLSPDDSVEAGARASAPAEVIPMLPWAVTLPRVVLVPLAK